MKTKLCTVRKDILERREKVPIGDGYYGESEPLPYRWSCDDDFHVFHEGKWKVAQSIDFNF